jgi:hypothetical protein
VSVFEEKAEKCFLLSKDFYANKKALQTVKGEGLFVLIVS